MTPALALPPTRRSASHGEAGYARAAAADWFWLIGYLAGKALMHALAGDRDKAKHHTISTAAALLNWHRAMGEDCHAP